MLKVCAFSVVFWSFVLDNPVFNHAVHHRVDAFLRRPVLDPEDVLRSAVVHLQCAAPERNQHRSLFTEERGEFEEAILYFGDFKVVPLWPKLFLNDSADVDEPESLVAENESFVFRIVDLDGFQMRQSYFTHVNHWETHSRQTLA